MEVKKERMTKKLKFILKRAIESATQYRVRYHPPPLSVERFMFTFDDGPSPSTINILDILDTYNVKASFFMVGENISAYPEIAREVVRRGHLIGSHGFTHRSMKTLSLRDYTAEIRKSLQMIYEMTGYKSSCFRPPLGEIRPVQVLALLRDGIEIWFWSCSIYEYGKIRFIDPTISDVGPESKKGKQIILLHDYLPAEVVEFTIRYFKNVLH
jgi:peptidoglycan-N-acetylglucosamine deacetylase